MVSIILWTYSLLVFVISAALCIWLGYRRGVFNSAMRLGFFLFSGILAFVIAKLLVNPIGGALSDSLATMLGEDLSMLTSMSTLQQLMIKLGGGLLAPIVFMLIFFVIDKLTFFAYIPLKKKLADNEKLHNIPHDKLFGGILGGVLAFCITLTCVMPVSYLGFADETVDRIASTSLGEELPDEMTEGVDAAAGTAIVKIDYAVSSWLFRGLASDARSVISTSFSLLDLVDNLKNAEDATSVSTAVQKLPKESLDLLVSVAKDALAQVVPEDEDAPYQVIIDTLSKALDKLPAMREELSTEAYAKEIEALTTVTTLINDPSSITGPEVIKTALSSSILTEVIVESSDVLTEQLSDVTSELSKKEKKEIKETINEYADEFDVDDEVVSSVLSIFGIS